MATGDAMRNRLTAATRTVLGLLAIIVTLTVSVAPALAAQRPDPALVRGIDSLFARFTVAGSPGCAVGLSREGTVELARGYGLADLERRAPITERTVFNVGSTSKQFVTFAVMLLADEGKLSLDDDVRRWIPELPEFGARITVRHLIHHTSGLRDYATMLSLMGWQAGSLFDESRLLGMIRGWRDLNFPPGDRFLYSNTGYVLLATIVTRASGAPWPDFAARRLFGPLGMAATEIRRDPFAVAPARALAYVPDSTGRFRLTMPNHDIVGSTAVMTTVTDLARWERNYYAREVGSETVMRGMHERGVLTTRDTIGYAGGLMMGTYRGVPMVSHAGATGGYTAEFIRFPEARAAVAVFCNHGGVNAATLATRVADRWLGSMFRTPRPADPPRREPGPRVRPWAPQMSEQAAVVGAYYSPELDRTWWILGDRPGQPVLLRRRDFADVELGGATADSLTIPGAVIRIVRGAGDATGLLVSAGRVLDLRFDRVPR
jgi:CubicO group peptidase (beta-lactamase class C family)